jgi:hypothetical protein
MAERTNVAAPTSGPSRWQALVGVVGAFGGLALTSTGAWARAEDGISHTAESIHQEPVFTASPKRVYEALTDAKQFTRLASGSLAAGRLFDYQVRTRGAGIRVQDRL